MSVSVKNARKEACQVIRKCVGENAPPAWRVGEESFGIGGILTIVIYLLSFAP